MALHDGTPLKGIPGWTTDFVSKLAESWITTAEQVVGAAASKEGAAALASQLEVPVSRVKLLVESARKALPSQVARELSSRVDTSQYGLGALPPRDE